MNYPQEDGTFIMFSNGAEGDYYHERNCYKCWKFWKDEKATNEGRYGNKDYNIKCELFAKSFMGLTEDECLRMGYTVDGDGSTWVCKELELESPEEKVEKFIDPNQLNLMA